MGYVKALLLFFGLLVIGLFAFLAALVALFVSPVFPQLRFRANSFFLIPFGWFAKKVIGIKTVVLNGARMSLARPAVLIGNHQSATDLGVIGTMAPPGSVIVAKKEIQNIPIFGWYFKIAGNLMIDRKKTLQARNQMDQIREVLEKRNLNLIIFPEGTRSRNQELLPFKKGAFHMAVATGYPVIPVICSSLKGKGVWESFDLKGGTIVISVMEPMETKNLNLKDVDTFRDEVYGKMLAELARVNELARGYDADPKKKSASCCS